MDFNDSNNNLLSPLIFRLFVVFWRLTDVVFFSFIRQFSAWFHAVEKLYIERKLFVAYRIKVNIAFIVKQLVSCDRALRYSSQYWMHRNVITDK